MRKYIPYYITNLKLALPIVVAQLGQILVQLADNIMVGRWGGEDALPLAAVSFGGQVAMLFFLFALGISMGLTPIVGALVGRGQRENTHSWLFNGLVLYFMAGLLLMLLQLAFQPMLYHLGQPREVVDAALTYYRIMAYSIPIVMIFSTFKQFLEGIGNTWISWSCCWLPTYSMCSSTGCLSTVHGGARRWALRVLLSLLSLPVQLDR